MVTTTNTLHRGGSDARPPEVDADGLDLAPIPIQAVDASGTIVWANRALLELVGHPLSDYVGHPVARFADAGDVSARLAAGEVVHDAPLVLRTRDGALRHCVVSASPHRRPARWFLRDVTAQRAADADRDRAIAELTRTVKLNDTFAGILGHDLRGPLSTIVMASQLLLGSVDGQRGLSDDSRSVRALERVLNSADRMQRMVDQLLDFARARVDGGIGLERKPADLADLARDVIEEVRVARPSWKLELETAGDPRGEFDGNRLSQVFSNLINNATQHGSPDAPLRVLVDGRDPAAVRVAIENRGAIPADVLPVLFSATRGTQYKGSRSQGLGLGLYITDHIVRAHGGRIAAASHDGVTTFHFELPRRGASAVVFDQPASSDRIPIAALAELSQAAEANHAQLCKEAARQREDRFRMLVDGIEDYAIFMLDAGGLVCSWNAGAERTTGYTADEIIGRHFSVFYPAEALGHCERELTCAARDGRFEHEGWRLRKDGTRYWVSTGVSALRDDRGALIGYAKITRDLTAQRKLDDDRVALAHAHEALRLRDEFLSLASHELKTPLTVLQLQLEALREQLAGDRITLAKLERSTRAVRRLTDLTEALLDVSRIATGRFQLQREPADLADVVGGAVDRLQESAEAAGCRLAVCADHVAGMWDRSRIDQVVSNLVANAIRYAAGAPIDVAVTRHDACVAIEVRDRGPGLPDGTLQRIFERFERAASMRHYGGLGLGLYVVRQIAEAHGGEVTACNLPAGGACFTVRLPVAAPSTEPVA